MHKLTKWTVMAIAGLIGAAGAQADDLDVINSFYADLLTTPSDVTMEQVTDVVVEDWVSVPTPRGGPGAEGMFKTLHKFGAAIPDLKWEPQEIIQRWKPFHCSGKRRLERPLSPFSGSIRRQATVLNIMSIDIHTVENGKIVKSYHVEEWAKAIGQLKGDKH